MREPAVSSVMTTTVISIGSETPFKTVVAIMAEHGISAVPVVGPQGTLIGVVSEADVLAKQEFHGGADPEPHGERRRRGRWFRALGLTAAEVMTTPVVTIGPAEPVALAARRLAEHNVRRLFVVDGDGTLVGVVSRRDVLGVFLRDDQEIAAEIEQLLSGDLGLPSGAGAVAVRVTDGVASVDGELERRSQAGLAVALVRAVPGVVSVRTSLRYRTDDLAGTGVWTGLL